MKLQAERGWPVKGWIKSALGAAVLCLGLSGCSFAGFSTQNLMSPPKVNADQQSIYKVLQGAQQDVTFIYPRSGQYRSAIIMEDFTGDGVEDAIGFHLLEDNGTNGVEVQFLTKNGEEWAAVSAFTNNATQVDRVCFGSLKGGGKSVLIGWGSTAGDTGRTATVNAYLFEDGEMREYTLGRYGEMTLTDFDGDGASEVFTIDKYLPAPEEGAEASPARARVYAFNQGKPEEMASAPADNAIASYSSMIFGQLTEEQQGVVVDGATADGSMTTQIFVMEEDRLRNYPAGVNTENYLNPYARPSAAAFTSRDINGDGMLEMPAVTRLPGLPEDAVPDTTSYLVEWDAFREGGHRRTVLYAMMNVRENYWFQVPYRFRRELSASNDPARRTVTYTQLIGAQDGTPLLGTALFTIRVFSQSAWESRGEGSGYEMLCSQNDSVYGIQVLTKDEFLLRCIDQVKESFQMITV